PGFDPQPGHRVTRAEASGASHSPRAIGTGRYVSSEGCAPTKHEVRLDNSSHQLNPEFWVRFAARSHPRPHPVSHHATIPWCPHCLHVATAGMTLLRNGRGAAHDGHTP